MIPAATGNSISLEGHDLLRVHDGKIVEHWDTVEAIPQRAIGEIGLVEATEQEDPGIGGWEDLLVRDLLAQLSVGADLERVTAGEALALLRPDGKLFDWLKLRIAPEGAKECTKLIEIEGVAVLAS